MSNEPECEEIPAGEAIVLWTDQIREAVRHNLYLVALLAALELPGMLSALLENDGKTTGPRYSAFLVRRGKFTKDYANRLWRFRCSLAHQSRLLPHTQSMPFAFVEPGAMIELASGGHVTLYPSGKTFELLDVNELALRLCDIAESWAMDEGQLDVVQRNLSHFLRRQEEGAPPNIQGVPMIF